MVYIVTYELRSEKSSADYEKLVALIKEEGCWACLGGSSYLIESDSTAVALRDKYAKVLDEDDMLYVGQVLAPAAWHGYEDAVTKWILKKLNK